MALNDYTVIHTARIDDTLRDKIGGKAYGLHVLKRAGARVPPWATVRADFFTDIILADETVSLILKGKSASSRKRSALQKAIREFTFSDEARKFLLSIYERISKHGAHPVAVRSSALDEDGESHSFAGQMDTVLNVRSREAFLDAAKTCFASVYNERAVVYRSQNSIEPFQVLIALVVQQMVEATVSGVLFTANTANDNPNETLISAAYGLGEGIVSGVVNADTIVATKTGTIVSQDIAEKNECVVYDDTGGTVVRDVPQDLRTAPALTKALVRKLVRIGKRIEKKYGMPMDIEFALKKQDISILQARPITTLHRPKKDNFLVWDNSNIVESYSGVTTPLTFTFIRRAYASVYRQFCEVLGVDEKTIEANTNLYTNMLGLINGRVYYNLINWYRLIALLPGFNYNKNFMEQMMGLSVIRNYITPSPPESAFRRFFVHFPKTVMLAARMVIVLSTLPTRIRKFFAHFYSVYDRAREMNFDSMSSADIMWHMRTLLREVLGNWKAPILNDLKAMIFYGILKRLTVSWGVDPAGNLHNELLAGEGDIKSKKVVTELFAVVALINANEGYRALFASGTPASILISIETNNAYIELRTWLKTYLYDYGVRSVEEMKLESTPVKDNPAFLIAMIQNYLANNVATPESYNAAELELRANAETRAKKALRWKFFFGIPKRAIYFWVLRNTRAAVRDRENQRFCRSEAYSIVRDMVRAVGKKWASQNIIKNVNDIFYLEWDEIWSFIEGTATTTNFPALIALRKKEYAAYEKLDSADHIETEGEVYAATNDFLRHPGGEEGALSGTGCSAGVVEGRARVLTKPDTKTKLKGEVLVARQTDPGWVVLFPSISALVVEKGSMLSHSAIVAREMGIPAVVGVRDATTLIHDGDVLRLDGSTGSVEIVSRAKKRKRQ